VLGRQDNSNPQLAEYMPRLACPKVGIDKIQIGNLDVTSLAFLMDGQVYGNFRFTAAVVPYQYEKT
jgi:hypothetical protein